MSATRPVRPIVARGPGLAAWLLLLQLWAPAYAQANPRRPGSAAGSAGRAPLRQRARRRARPSSKSSLLGTQRIEPATVLTYITLHDGDTYSEPTVDHALKTLFATGLFSDVKINCDGSTLTVNVVENPIINQVVFEGNSKVSTRTSPRKSSSSRARSSRAPRCRPTSSASSNSIAATASSPPRVDPQIIQRPQNRVDLIFSINEGPTTGVARINFIGNKVFDDDTLSGQIATEESGLVANSLRPTTITIPTA